ncbi:MAG: hypothetical protein MSJ26_01145 [Oscillospiraceae bacterium]|nr:hypothetical protein [Oscillospiraceae bacterium]
MNKKTDTILNELYIYFTTFGDVVKDTLDLKKHKRNVKIYENSKMEQRTN